MKTQITVDVLNYNPEHTGALDQLIASALWSWGVKASIKQEGRDRLLINMEKREHE
ncbi:hypothetical protein [Schleiferilactobacillus perolens]|uniref:Uncharacterized protein n=1 Tax=Schleiferilactobacillus perolens DSM 12744 TaxID=1423792 RepID=A0A0R1MYC2_9LACO|nr:hypothetical protein [Schleiferilactobacillus perolens]KRL13041.1 hypothetical protein FD09_GL002581 [Schleiferilactobacillus perolens DSM 12744]